MHGWILLENNERHPREKGLLTIKHILNIFLLLFFKFYFSSTFALNRISGCPLDSTLPPWYFNILLW